ncbi:MAG: L,D-transpeptidase family protein [Pseudomonadota bacterium]
MTLVCKRLLLISSLVWLNPTPASVDNLHDPAEARLGDSLRLLQAGKLDAAMQAIDALLRDQPTFQLGHAVRADIASQIAGQSGVLAEHTALAALRHEASQRFASQHNAAQRLDKLPANLLEPHPNAQTIVLVDLTANRLYQYERDGANWRLVGDHYVTIGKSGAGKRVEGDNRTPIGLYRIQPFLPDEALPELYGYGALPLDYPNPWDRHMRRTGSGIWIHGQPRSSYARPPHDSEGCVVISNRAMPGLHEDTTAGATAVIMVSSIEWVDRQTLASRRADLARVHDTWRRSWAAGQMDRFMSLHAAGFRNDALNRVQFESRKRALARTRSDTRIDISNREMLMFEDLDGTTMAEIRFTQDYVSLRYRERSAKTQYWSLKGGRWQLELEAERSLSRAHTPTLARAEPAETTDAAPYGAFPSAR